MWVIVKDLPDCVRAALAAVEYGRTDIEVQATETAVLSGGASKGQRAFTLMVNLETGQREGRFGSWGGPNMFAKDNPVDLDTQVYPMPSNGVIIKGQTGYPRTFATIYVSPAIMPKMITAGPETPLTQEERDALYCYRAIKGGQYRRDELRRRKVQPATVDALVSRGLLKSNRAGAVQITTDGRNAVGNYDGR